jgi:hypothetical protein
MVWAALAAPAAAHEIPRPDPPKCLPTPPAQANVKPRPPTPADAYLPAVNACEFADSPPNMDQLLAEATRGHDEQGATAQAEDPAARRARSAARKAHKTAKARMAIRPGLVTCGASASLMWKLNPLGLPDGYSVRGNASCAPGQTGGASDLLSARMCVDIWALAGYWNRLACGPWASRAATTYVGGIPYDRSCTYQRYYRPVGGMQNIHGNAAAGEYPGYYGQCS